jgi:hypothetical protein
MIYIRFVRSRMIPLSLLIAEFSSFSRMHGIGRYLSVTNLSGAGLLSITFTCANIQEMNCTDQWSDCLILYPYPLAFVGEYMVNAAMEWSVSGRRKLMEIVFSVKVPSEGKTVQVLLLCPECREEIEMARDLATVRFRCSNHGELGMISSSEFAQALQRVQESIADQHGFGKPVRINFLPAGPQRVN